MRLQLALALLSSTAFAAPISIIIEGGDFDRRDTVVEFKLPSNTKSANILNGEGQSASLQIEPDGQAWFIERDLKRGAKKVYTLGNGGVPEFAQAKAEKGAITLRVGGKTALTYRTEKTELPVDRPNVKEVYRRGGYIHPVLSPGGKLLTDDYPADHKHHHGIWFAWTHTEFDGRKPDFWNMANGIGTVEFVSLDRTWSGPVHAGLTSRHRQVDLSAPKPMTALNETWNVRLYAVGNETKKPYFIFDVEVTDVCATNLPVKLPKYRYGGIGVRAPGAWNGKDNLNFLNSEGVTDRSKGDKNETVGRWAHLGGLVDGILTGLAVLGHPDNVRAPQPQRIHPTEPFLNFAPQQAGDVEITPGRPLALRYRFVVADGAPDKVELDRLWNDYAHPPVVKVVAP
ncbi:MAG: hypothetical protein EXS33_07390 [Pedosphaera sp.]|nr:hypothetical protein [Pedosphaera sp.]